ncbi:tRNA glutamyl-Q(34) synthetase GluQRS [Thioclava sp. BHET1]|nr:tRNA glutamyl-Q(34) synthetase GluQRS [Thioclava sp. BHET1]
MITRFAPSPTGPLHLGHAYSAILAHDMAKKAGGQFLLRIEDIDQSRSRRQWEDQIYRDLDWLGLDWERPVMRQSERLQLYRNALETLWERDLLFACNCTRRDIEAAVSAPQEGASYGPDGLIYPGTCRISGARSPGAPMPDTALRLNMERAATDCHFDEMGAQHAGPHEVTRTALIETVGDVVLARRDMGCSYHLAVVLDDAEQGITHVTRGVDLFEATQIHVLLQKLLQLPTPTYWHHDLIRDSEGKRLAKRDDARALSTYRDAGVSPADIRRMLDVPLA